MRGCGGDVGGVFGLMLMLEDIWRFWSRGWVAIACASEMLMRLDSPGFIVIQDKQ
jgi:hypothetical protein